MPMISTTRPHGILGTNRAPRNRINNEPTPSSAVIGLISPSDVRMDHARWITSPDSGFSPSRLGTSPNTMSITSPKTNPVTIGRDMNSAAQPSFATPPMARPRPAPIANADVNPTAAAGSPWAMSATSDPESTDTVDTGPTTRCGEDPRTA